MRGIAECDGCNTLEKQIDEHSGPKGWFVLLGPADKNGCWPKGAIDICPSCTKTIIEEKLQATECTWGTD